METSALVIFIVIALVAVALAWFAGNYAAKSKLGSQLSEKDMRAFSAEARVEELRDQVAKAAPDFETLRGKLSDSESARNVAETKLLEMEKNLAEQKATLEEAKSKLADAFKSLAAEALALNNKGFLTLAEEKFGSLKDQAKHELDTRKTAIEEFLKPLNTTLSQYQTELRDFVEKNQSQIGSVKEQLSALGVSTTSLQLETANLVNALKSPQARGRWGEIALRRIAELAGMSIHCDFEEQVTIKTEDGKQRPDMVVKLPAGRDIIVDSKAPFDAYYESIGAKTDQARSEALARYAKQMRIHVNKLSKKEYWSGVSDSLEFVIMFVPGDPFLSAAAEQDPNLIEYAMSEGVVIATPATLIALLKAIAFGWRQEAISQNSQKILQLGQDLSDKLATITEHMIKLGKSIEGSVENYNKFVGSLERNVLSSARKLKELGAGGKKEIEDIPPVDLVPRALPNTHQSEVE